MQSASSSPGAGGAASPGRPGAIRVGSPSSTARSPGSARMTPTSGRRLGGRTPGHTPSEPQPPPELLPPMTPQQRTEFITAFEQFDKAKEGSLPFFKVAKLMGALGYPVVAGQIRSLAEVAKIKEDRLTAEQFADVVMAQFVRKPKLSEDAIISLLERIPAAHPSGALTSERASKLLTDLGEPLDEEELASLSKEAGLKPGASVTVRHLVTSIMRAE
jgi:Ca2+-binding EF-hand superfamily protein